MQANGAEILRLACCLATECGVEVCAPVHDALMICARFDRLDQDIATTRAAMVEAGRVVLAGFELGVDVHTPAPHRYMDGRGKEMWDRVLALVQLQQQQQTAAAAAAAEAGMSQQWTKEGLTIIDGIPARKVSVSPKERRRREQFVMLPM